MRLERYQNGQLLEVVEIETPPEQRRTEIIARLDEIDRASARSLREAVIAQAGGKPAPAFAKAKLETLESEAASLRAELAAL